MTLSTVRMLVQDLFQRSDKMKTIKVLVYDGNTKTYANAYVEYSKE